MNNIIPYSDALLPISDEIATRTIDKIILNPSRFGLTKMRMAGESMKGIIDAGDIIFVKQLHDVAWLEYDRIYVIKTERQTIVRRVYKGQAENTLLLRSTNPSWWQDVEIKKERITEIYTVSKILKEFDYSGIYKNLTRFIQEKLKEARALKAIDESCYAELKSFTKTGFNHSLDNTYLYLDYLNEKIHLKQELDNLKIKLQFLRMQRQIVKPFLP